MHKTKLQKIVDGMHQTCMNDHAKLSCVLENGLIISCFYTQDLSIKDRTVTSHQQIRFQIAYEYAFMPILKGDKNDIVDKYFLWKLKKGA